MRREPRARRAVDLPRLDRHSRHLDVASRAAAPVTTPARITLGRAWDLLDRLLPGIAAACPEIQEIEPAGDIRRFEPLVSSIVLVARTDDPAGTARSLGSIRDLAPIALLTDRRVVGTHRQTPVEILLATPDDYGSTLFMATGSAAHLGDVRRLGLPPSPQPSEETLYSTVGLAFIPPELRHGTGEAAAAASGTLPRLVTTADIRGDLHMHTTYSDGRDALEAMVAGCHALGYEYIAITDHSSGSAASRTLARAEIPQQRDEIDELRERFAGLTILHGIEVDILPDGRLDFEDETLAQFDIVLASLHDHARHNPARLTARSLAAVRHPLVNILCHPANQLVGHFEGYGLDFDELFAAAADTGTALEVDGAPSHLDLDGERARAAVAAGVTLTIDSDCHRVPALERQMRFGVGTARRGWVEARHVLNSRPLSEILGFIAAKRGG
jgi:DNA polymerase (family 10)